jgi:hypothetical protein
VGARAKLRTLTFKVVSGRKPMIVDRKKCECDWNEHGRLTVLTRFREEYVPGNREYLL